MIIPMKKASIAFLSSDTRDIVFALQKSALFMPSESEGTVRTGEAPALDREAEGALAAYGKHRKSPLSLPEYTVAEFEAEDDAARLDVLRAIELSEQLDATRAMIRHTEDAKARLIPFEELDCTAEELTKTKYTELYIGTISHPQKSKKPRALDVLKDELGYECTVFHSEGALKYFYLFVFKEDAKRVGEILEEGEFEPITLPYRSGTAKEEAEKLKSRLSQLCFTEKTLTEKLEKEAENSAAVELFYDREKARADRAELPGAQTLQCTVLEGWVRSDKTEELEALVSSVSDAAYVTFEDPKEGDNVPTATKNNKFTEQYTAITNAFSVPSKTDTDPNPFMAPWYFLFYGMMIGDVGYGALIALLTMAFKKIKKPRGNTLRLINLFMYSSVTAVIFGVIYGSYFGESLLPPLWDTMQNTVMPSMILCIVCGALHLFTGMIVNGVRSIKAGHPADAICDQFSWIVLITGIGVMFLNMTVGAALAIVGVLVILTTGGRKKKGFGKVTGGLLALYGIANYLSDLLSYTRIFALALSSGIIAMVMNILAGMMFDIGIPVVNVIAGVLVLIFGHTLNIALGMLGAYVHTSRLQYIEFFGKFYEGGGTLFRPLSIDTKYTVIKHTKKEGNFS